MAVAVWALQDGARSGHATLTKESTRLRPGTRAAAENDMDWTLKDILKMCLKQMASIFFK
jgi:hypothetical protein